ncbi:hypothetical protein BSK20_00965 [SR1 bacterium human oral taxon HOT-345]|nr:hypothetical protein BSK20_00965 [SR1 bacterium human oral taxon HOT-345]
MNSREYPEHKTSTFSYEKFSTYLEKEKQTLEKILKILAKNQNEKEFFLNEFLPSLEEARKIWKSSGNFRTGYHDALKFLTTKREKSLRNTFGEPIIDPESHLKPLLNKYSSFISQQRKEQEKQTQQKLIENLQGKLNQKCSSLYALGQEDLEQLKKHSSHITKPTKVILHKLGPEALFNLIFSHGQIRDKLFAEQEQENSYEQGNSTRELYEKGDNIRELYGDPRNLQNPLQSFEENFFSQFKNLIDPREKLNNQEIKTILEELDSYLKECFKVQFLEEERNKQKQQAQKREIEYLETHRTEIDEEGNILPVPTGYHSGYSHEE